MVNTSATGGYLKPSTQPPAYDQPLDVQLQAVVVGITGMDGSLVRPRWQPRPPQQPDASVNWCAIGIVRVGAAYGHHTRHNPDGDGSDETEAYEDLELLASFYGPGCVGVAALLRDGLRVPQNREALRAGGMALTSADTITPLGEYVTTEWRRRADLPLLLTRVVSRTYPVLNLLSAQGSIISQKAGEPPEISDFTVTEN